MKTKLYLVVFLLPCSTIFASSSADSTRIEPPMPDKLLWIIDDNCNQESMRNQFQLRHGIIPYDYSKAPKMLRILPNPNTDAKILKLMPNVNKNIIWPNKMNPLKFKSNK